MHLDYIQNKFCEHGKAKFQEQKQVAEWQNVDKALELQTVTDSQDLESFNLDLLAVYGRKSVTNPLFVQKIRQPY